MNPNLDCQNSSSRAGLSVRVEWPGADKSGTCAFADGYWATRSFWCCGGEPSSRPRRSRGSWF